MPIDPTLGAPAGAPPTDPSMMAPPGAMGAMPPDQANGMSPEQMKSDLKQKFAGVESLNKSNKSKQIMSQNDLEAMRGDIIRSIFDTMKNHGVDVTNPESIKSFLADLEANDPDLYDMFDMAFGALLGSQPQSPDAGTQDPSAMQNLGQSPMGVPTLPPPGGNVPGASPFEPLSAPPSQFPPVPPSPSGPSKFSGITNAMNG